jgi:TatD DNase family protein
MSTAGDDIHLAPAAPGGMIDSHSHLADEAFGADVGAVLDRARGAGLEALLCVVDVSDLAEVVRADGVSARWEGIRTTAGVHPHRAGPFAGRPEAAADLVAARLALDPKARAVGAVGLDYHYDFAPRGAQREVFAAQVALARDTGLPLVIHTREADEDTIAILEREGLGRVRGVFHCFSGDRRLAERALGLGFYVSFSGMLTFPKADEIRRAAAIVPLDRVLVETDCPYLAPVPYRGRRNEPAWVARTVAALAEIHRDDAGGMAALTSRNYRELFAP